MGIYRWIFHDKFHKPSSIICIFFHRIRKKPWSKITELDDGNILTGKPFFRVKTMVSGVQIFPNKPMIKIWSISGRYCGDEDRWRPQATHPGQLGLRREGLAVGARAHGAAALPTGGGGRHVGFHSGGRALGLGKCGVFDGVFMGFLRGFWWVLTPLVISHGYGKWPIFIVDLPIKDCDFP